MVTRVSAILEIAPVASENAVAVESARTALSQLKTVAGARVFRTSFDPADKPSWIPHFGHDYACYPIVKRANEKAGRWSDERAKTAPCMKRGPRHVARFFGVHLWLSGQVNLTRQADVEVASWARLTVASFHVVERRKRNSRALPRIRKMKTLRDAEALLKGRQSRKIDRNTYLERRGTDAIAVRLHWTDIITFTPHGAKYSTGGWHTMTTKGRMNTYGPASIQSIRGDWWFVYRRRVTYTAKGKERYVVVGRPFSSGRFVDAWGRVVRTPEERPKPNLRRSGLVRHASPWDVPLGRAARTEAKVLVRPHPTALEHASPEPCAPTIEAAS